MTVTGPVTGVTVTVTRYSRNGGESGSDLRVSDVTVTTGEGPE